MMCVIFMHLAAGPLRVDVQYLGKNWHLLNLATSLAFTAVALFFMMSGYLLLSSPHTTDVGYLLKKRLPRLLVPFLFWSAVAALELSLLNNTGLAGAVDRFAAVGSGCVMIHMWFMYPLIALYLISPFLYGGINGLNEKGRRYLLVLIVAAMAILTAKTVLPAEVSLYLPYKIPAEMALFGGHIAAVLLGWYLGRSQRKLPTGLVLGAGLADWAFITFMTWRRTLASGGYDATFQTQDRGFELLLAVCIFLFFKQSMDRPLGLLHRITGPVASLAFPIYLMHNLVILVLERRVLPTGNAPQVVFSTLCVALICYLLLKTAATIPRISYLVTGMSFQEASRSCNWIYTFRKRG